MYNAYHGYTDPNIPKGLNSVKYTPETTVGPTKNSVRMVNEFLSYNINDEVGMSLDEWLETPRYFKDTIKLSLDALAKKRAAEAAALNREES